MGFAMNWRQKNETGMNLTMRLTSLPDLSINICDSPEVSGPKILFRRKGEFVDLGPPQGFGTGNLDGRHVHGQKCTEMSTRFRTVHSLS
jgi:hypothetical protein